MSPRGRALVLGTVALFATAAAWIAPSRATAPAYAEPVAVYPTPGDRYELPGTQITFRGVPAAALGTVRVVGSKTGSHSGRIEADADGDGASFIPDKPFAAGETVTVSTELDVTGGSDGSFSFTIESPGPQLAAAALPLASGSGGVQRFRSLPGLEPASVTVTQDRAPASQGDIFVAPQFGPKQDGPMILDSKGNLIWFRAYPVSKRTLVTDFRVQQLHGQPVLTWWQGSTNAGSGRGEGVILDDSYQQIATVHAGNGLRMDLHEFLLTDSGDAYLIAVSPVRLPGLSRTVENAVIQEVEIKTGLVLFQWDALDHVSLRDSYEFGAHASGHILDPYHANSISLDAAGNLVVSMRNTDAVYDIDRQTGTVLWTLGGKASSFRQGPGTRTAFQHDAVVQPNGDLTVFDDGAGPPRVHPYSRGIELALDTADHTAKLVKAFDHAPALSANFEGGMQLLPGGDAFLGWGQRPYFSEDDAAGKQVFDAHFTVPTSTYRAYRLRWSAEPRTRPALAVGSGPDGTATAYASWNGATDVAAWRILGGPSSSSLAPVATRPKRHFESAMSLPTGDRDVAVQALSAGGKVLATSPTRAVPAHLAAAAPSRPAAR